MSEAGAGHSNGKETNDNSGDFELIFGQISLFFVYGITNLT